MQTIVYPKTAPLPISLRPTSTSLFTLIQQKSSINELATAEVFRFFWKYKQRLFQSRRYFATTLIWRHGNSKKSARSGNSDCPSRNYGVERLSNGSFLLGSQNLGAVLGSQKDSQSAKKKNTHKTMHSLINTFVIAKQSSLLSCDITPPGKCFIPYIMHVYQVRAWFSATLNRKTARKSETFQFPLDHECSMCMGLGCVAISLKVRTHEPKKKWTTSSELKSCRISVLFRVSLQNKQAWEQARPESPGFSSSVPLKLLEHYTEHP